MFVPKINIADITGKRRKNIIFYLEAKVVKLSLVLYDETLAKA